MNALNVFADVPRWVVWRNEPRDDDPGKLTKVPYQTNGRKASSRAPRTWCTLSAATEAALRIVNGAGGGVGIVLGQLDEQNVLAGIDLDTCRHDDGTLEAWATEIIERFPTYAEVSPSGAGIKLFFLVAMADCEAIDDGLLNKAKTGRQFKKAVSGDHPPGVEIYFRGRYFAVTGQSLGAADNQLASIPLASLLWLLSEAGPALAAKTTPGKGGHDKSRSAKAFREGSKLRRQGKTFEEMCEALRNNADPDIAAWCREKGDQRQLLRIWDKADPAGQTDPIDELNKTFAVVRVVNRVAILNEHLDPQGRPTFSLLSPDSFKLFLANQKTEITIADKDGNEETKRVSLASLWIASPRRRQYEGITFAPERTPPGYFNLWNGFAVKPSEFGSCKLFKQHLLDNVCDGRSDWYNWVFGWFADIFQHPAHKCGTSLALRGEMGVGKTIVGKTFGHLLGLHYVPVADPRYVTGRFNAHLVRCLLFFCDEAFWAGDRAGEGKLRDLVTGDQHPIELKGFEAFFVPNFVRLLICGNREWLVPAGLGERRFATLDVADHHKEDIPYFKAVDQELKAGGFQRLLHELLEFDLSTVDLRHIPKTEALLDQKIASLSPEDGWWFDILKRGRLPHFTKDARAGRCPGQMLYDDYIEHAQKQGARRRQIETAIGIFLNKTARGLTTAVETFIVEDASGQRAFYKPPITGRGTVYSFPSLKECRRAFEEKLHQSVTWPDHPDWLTQT
jgi:hypothetical protein